MQFNLKGLVDDDTRRQIREMVLGEARAVARNDIDKTMARELERLAGRLGEKFKESWTIERYVQPVLERLMVNRWTDIAKMIAAEVAKAVEEKVQEKLRNKTVFEAEKQFDLIRQVAQAEAQKEIKIAMAKLRQASRD